MSVHFNKNSMGTILLLKEGSDIPGVGLTTNTNQERAMTVTLKNGNIFNSRSANLGSIIMTQKRKITRQKNKITLITMLLLIIFVFIPSRKIQTS